MLPALPVGQAQAQLAALHPPGALDLRPGRAAVRVENGTSSPFNAGRQRRHPGIVDVQHGEVFRPLRGEQPRLGRRVGLHVGVAIQVIGRDVQQHPHPRAEPLGGLQLEARRLDHHEPPLGRRAAHRLGQRRAQVATDERGVPGGRQHLPAQRGGGRLAVGAGDGHHRRPHEARRQLQLARDRHPGRPRRRHLGQRRHARRQHDQLRLQERLPPVPAQLARHRGGQRPPAAAPSAASGWRSVTVTRAPSRAHSWAAAMPERPAPTTSTRLPSNAWPTSVTTVLSGSAAARRWRSRTRRSRSAPRCAIRASPSSRSGGGWEPSGTPAAWCACSSPPG